MILTSVERLWSFLRQQRESLFGRRSSKGYPEVFVTTIQLGADIVEGDTFISVTLDNEKNTTDLER